MAINLMNCSKSEVKVFLNSFDIILSDVNGVLWNTNPISGVKETLCEMKNLKKDICIVSNNSCFDPKKINTKFINVGIEINQDNFIHPAKTAIDYLKDINFKGKIFCVSCQFVKQYFIEAGFEAITEGDYFEENESDFLKKLHNIPNVHAVFVDADININYLKICKAIAILAKPEILFLVGTTDKWIPVSSNKSILSPGHFQEMICLESGRNPIYVGKPSMILKSTVMKKFNITHPERILFIGDTFEQDMRFASLCGFKKLLVFSGYAKEDQLKSITDNNLLPDYYIETLGCLLPIMKQTLE